MLVLAPSGSRALVRDSRRAIRAAASDPRGRCSSPARSRVLAMGQSLPAPARRGGTAGACRSTSRARSSWCSGARRWTSLHVHEPFAPSASAAALRHSRALNVGTFHSPTERVLSTQVARRFIELFFGRLDARMATSEATRDADLELLPRPVRALLRPGWTWSGSGPGSRAGDRAGRDRVRRSTRSALRCGCSCGRCDGCRRRSTGGRRSGPRGSATRCPGWGRALRERVRFTGGRRGAPRPTCSAARTSLCAASGGMAPAAALTAEGGRRRLRAGRGAAPGLRGGAARRRARAAVRAAATRSCSRRSSRG